MPRTGNETEREKRVSEILSRGEETSDAVKGKIEKLEGLISEDEDRYLQKRRQYVSTNTVWYSYKTVSVTIVTFVVTLISIPFIGPALGIKGFSTDDPFSSFLGGLETFVPAAFGISLIPIILSVAKSNLNLQKLNSDIEVIFSEMMVLRNKVTLLQQKLVNMDRQWS